MKYKDLKKQHDELELEYHQELQMLYEGGHELQECAKNFLPKLVNESDTRYKARLKIPCYINYFNQIVGQYINGLFSDDLNIVPASDAENPSSPGELPEMDFWMDFDKDADLKENPFKEVIKSLITDALIHKKAFVSVDYPNFGFADSLKQEKSEGFDRAYLVQINTVEIIDWKYAKNIVKSYEFDSEGKKKVKLSAKKLTYMKLYRCYEDEVKIEEFKIWKQELINKNYVVSWELYQVKWQDEKTPPKDDDNFEPVESGITPQFTDLPFIELSLPDDLWIGGKIGDLVKLIWQRTSSLLAAEDTSLVQMLIVYLGAETPEVDGEVIEAQSDPNRGISIRQRWEQKGSAVLGKDDKAEYLVPDTTAFQFIDEQINSYVDEMFRICYLMAVSPIQTAKKDAGSGAAKKEDRFAFNQALLNLGDLVKSFCFKIYNLISLSRKENVVWVARGLDDFDIIDPAELLTEMQAADGLPLKSKTYKSEYKLYLMGRRLKNLPPETMEQIRKEEFETGIDKIEKPIVNPGAIKQKTEIKGDTNG